MGTTAFWGEILGWFMIFLGVMVIMRAEFLRQILKDFTNDRANGMIIGIVMAFIGLLVVTSHNTWNGAAEVIVSLIGWIMLIKGVLYMWLPAKALKEWIGWFRYGSWIVIGGLVEIGVGIYLLTQINAL